MTKQELRQKCKDLGIPIKANVTKLNMERAIENAKAFDRKSS